MVWLHNVIWFGECLRWTEWTEKHRWRCFAQQWRNLQTLCFINTLSSFLWSNWQLTELMCMCWFVCRLLNWKNRGTRHQNGVEMTDLEWCSVVCYVIRKHWSCCVMRSVHVTSARDW